MRTGVLGAYDDAAKQLRNEEVLTMCADLDAIRAELRALKAETRAEKLCKRREANK